MNAPYYSPSTGVLVVPTGDALAPSIHYLESQEQSSGAESLYMLSQISDWETTEIEREDLQSTLRKCTSEYWLTRASR